MVFHTLFDYVIYLLVPSALISRVRADLLESSPGLAWSLLLMASRRPDHQGSVRACVRACAADPPA